MLFIWLVTNKRKQFSSIVINYYCTLCCVR